MKKRNLIIPLVFSSSLFIPSIEALESTTEFNSLENENNIAIDILIAEGSGCGGSGGGGGMSPIKKKEKDLENAIKSLRFFESKKAEAETRGESTEKIDKKIEKYKKKIIKLDPDYLLPVILGGDPITRDPSAISNFKKLNENQLNTIKQKTKTMMEEIWEPYKRIAEENRRRKESGEYTTEDGLISELWVFHLDH